MKGFRSFQRVLNTLANSVQDSAGRIFEESSVLRMNWECWCAVFSQNLLGTCICSYKHRVRLKQSTREVFVLSGAEGKLGGIGTVD